MLDTISQVLHASAVYLHANSASSSLTRLLDMEVPTYKLTASLRGVLAQRLMRKVCPECSTERPASDPESRVSGSREPPDWLAGGVDLPRRALDADGQHACC